MLIFPFFSATFFKYAVFSVLSTLRSGSIFILILEAFKVVIFIMVFWVSHLVKMVKSYLYSFVTDTHSL